jgi:hypothetical protein
MNTRKRPEVASPDIPPWQKWMFEAPAGELRSVDFKFFHHSCSGSDCLHGKTSLVCVVSSHGEMAKDHYMGCVHWAPDISSAWLLAKREYDSSKVKALCSKKKK